MAAKKKKGNLAKVSSEVLGEIEKLDEATKDSEFEVKKGKVVELTDRQKFHEFYREVYLADPIVDDVPHHADSHGILGYENNSGGFELHTKADKTVERVEIVGLCKDCTRSHDSAAEAYAKVK